MAGELDDEELRELVWLLLDVEFELLVLALEDELLDLLLKFEDELLAVAALAEEFADAIALLVLLDELSEVLLFDRLLALVTERLVEDVETEFLELDVADN